MPVDAVPQPGRRRAVGKHMAEVAVASRTADLGADHAVRGVAQLAHRVGGGRLEEARPTAMRAELRIGAEQWLPAAGAGIEPGLVVFEERAREGPFGAGLAEDV